MRPSSATALSGSGGGGVGGNGSDGSGEGFVSHALDETLVPPLLARYGATLASLSAPVLQGGNFVPDGEERILMVVPNHSTATISPATRT